MIPYSSGLGRRARVDYRCPKCGSPDVVSDAGARWNIEKQQWEISDICDCTTCRACGYDSDHGFEVSL